MNSKHSFFISFFVCMLSGPTVSASCVLYDTAGDSTSNQRILDEFVVQSFKQDRNLGLAPVAATALSGTLLQSKNISDIKGITSIVPNFFMPDYGSKLTSPVYIRGVGSKINSPSVGLYVDDMPYFEKSAFDFDLNEIDRIEVLRGPQGTLYGRNTMGGLIKIHTRSPFKYPGTRISVGGGNYETYRVQASHGGSFTPSLAYSVSGTYNHGGGFFTNIHSGKKADGYDNASLRGRIEWHPAEQWRLKLTSVYDFNDQGGYPYAPFNPDNSQYAPVNYDAPGVYRRQMSTSGLSVSYIGSEIVANSQTSFQYLKDHQGIDQDFTPVSEYYACQNQKQHMISEEINIKPVASGKHYDWLFGAFGFWQDIDNTVTLDFLSQQKRSVKYYAQPTYGVALYHQSEFRNLGIRGLTLTAGLRYDLEWSSMNYSGVMQTLDALKQTDALLPFDSKLHFGQLTPKVALQYEFPSSGILYASVVKGYKTGGFNTSFETDEQRTFKPEYSWNYEIGAKHPFFDKRLSAEIALFLIDWRHQQISQPLPSGRGSMLTNAGRSRSTGVEVSLAAQIVNGLMLQTSYGFTHATFIDYKNGEKDFHGHFLPFVPQHTLSLGGNYSWGYPFKGIDRLVFGLDYNAQGRIYWREDNHVSQPFYGLLNARISAMRGVFSLSLWARNMTNTQYTAFYFESGNKKLAQKGKPFTFGADLQVSF